MLATPNIKWAERKDKLFVTIQLDEVKDTKIDILDENVLYFSGVSAGKSYELKLELFDAVDKSESKWTLDTRNIFLNIKKKTKGPYWNYINKDKKKYTYIHFDWALFIEEDEEDQGKDDNFGGMGNFMNMGDMGGMGDDLPDEDDVEPKKDEDLGDLDKDEESK
jgi:cytosolic prostaglandin-E synthase